MTPQLVSPATQEAETDEPKADEPRAIGNDCSTCGGTMINVQGLLDCPTCGFQAGR